MQWLYGLDRIHRLGSPVSRQNLLSLVVDCGAAGFDVAPMYGNGIAERELGHFFLQNGMRGRMIVNTKFGIPYLPYGYLPSAIYKPCWLLDQVSRRVLRRRPRRRYTGKALMESVETSLRRLHTDYVDTLFIHEPLQTIEEADELKAGFESLRQSGKVRNFGVSGENPCIYAIADRLDLPLVQAPLYLLKRQRKSGQRASAYHLRQDLAREAGTSPGLTAYFSAAAAVGADTVLYQTTNADHLRQFIGR